jgi:sulfoxide reductase heme-binding subunit YedZ
VRISRLKPALWIAGLAPFAWLTWQAFYGDLTADPVKYITHITGRVTVGILVLTLSVTPLRRLTGFNQLVKVRRLVGLFAFFYAVVHLGIYLVFDRGFVFTELGEDIVKRPFITVGFTVWLILLSLAVTSPQRVLRWMGGKRWAALHRLIYLAAVLAVVHFAWSQKKDLRPIVPFAVAVGAVLTARAGLAVSDRRRAAAGRRLGPSLRSPVTGGP